MRRVMRQQQRLAQHSGGEVLAALDDSAQHADGLGAPHASPAQTLPANSRRTCPRLILLTVDPLML